MVIGDRVEIGAKCTVARGAIDDTIVSNDVKIDDQVHVAHNCFIGDKTIITACAELSGGVKVGKSCWLGPNSSIIEKVKLGDNAFVGIGVVVDRDLGEKSTVKAASGMSLRQAVKLRKLLG